MYAEAASSFLMTGNMETFFTIQTRAELGQSALKLNCTSIPEMSGNKNKRVIAFHDRMLA